MLEYIIVGACFLVLIIIKFYLFKVSYDKKMKYYTDPDEMAVEFFSQMQKQNTPEQIKQTIENIHLLAQKYVKRIVEEFNKGQTDTTLTNVSESLRNTSIIVALIKKKFGNDEKLTKQKLKLIGQTVYEDFTIFKKIIEWCNQEESSQKNTKQNKKTQLDIHLVVSIKAYSEYLNNELGTYFKPK